jgi:hypothetical protein
MMSAEIIADIICNHPLFFISFSEIRLHHSCRKALMTSVMSQGTPNTCHPWPTTYNTRHNVNGNSMIMLHCALQLLHETLQNYHLCDPSP